MGVLILNNKVKTSIDGLNCYQAVLIDWFQFNILNIYEEFYSEYTPYQNIDLKNCCYILFEDLFNIKSDELIFEWKGICGYTANISWNNIRMYFNHHNPGQGINVIMSGKGCRDFEDLDLTWFELIKKISKYKRVNYNRIDIAIDDYTNKFYDLEKIKWYVDNGLVVSRFRTTFNVNYKTIDVNPESLGCTIQFGSKASNLQITFYDKLKERENENIIVSEDVKYWSRCELRFRHEYAEQVSQFILNGDLINTTKGILYDHIRFIIPDNKSSDSNKWRRDTCSWWLDYLDSVEKLHLSTITIESDITKKRKWLMTSTPKTTLQILLSEVDTFNVDEVLFDLILKILDIGIDKLDKKSLELVNNYRQKHNLDIISYEDICNLIYGIKEKIVLDNKKK